MINKSDFQSVKEVEDHIRKCSDKINDIDNYAASKNRPLSAKEASLKRELYSGIVELRGLLAEPAPETLPPEGSLISGDSFDSLTDRATRTLTGRSYREMFGFKKGQTLDTGGFKDAGEFLTVLHSGRFDPRLVQASFGETVPSQGGFAVPTQFASEWLDAALPAEIMRQLVKTYPMTESSLLIPGWDGADMSAGLTHGGFSMEFLAEGSDGTPQTAKLRQIELKAKTGAIYCNASLELIQDGKNFAQNLQTALIKSIGFGFDRYLIGGAGASEPLGALNSPCAVSVSGEEGQHVSLVYQNFKKMFARQLNPAQAVWTCNSTSIPELLEITIDVGTGGVFVPLLNESNGKFTIFGRPVFFSPHMPILGAAGDVMFFDPNFYALGLRSEVAIDVSDAPRWTQRERSFRILVRFDGMCTLNKAVTPIHGDTLSPVVVMEARTA